MGSLTLGLTAASSWLMWFWLGQHPWQQSVTAPLPPPGPPYRTLLLSACFYSFHLSLSCHESTSAAQGSLFYSPVNLLRFRFILSNSNHPPCQSWSFEGSQNTINGYEMIWLGQGFELVRLVQRKCPSAVSHLCNPKNFFLYPSG